MIITKDSTTVTVPIGQQYIMVGNNKIQTDTKAIILNGRTYLTIRAVLEAFGATVSWDETNKSIAIE